ncbi:MAG: hypothetical protein B6D56_01065 [Candidatus Omnitrophica bacterium 4484_70.1]|nr:MAG: hypothetical protein B6D56_01065 [Candidatus Omnitrophica bacterium 4484_70.1]
MNLIDRDTEERIKLGVKNILNKEGLEMIEFKIFYSQGRFTIRSVVDYSQGGVTLDMCAKMNKQVFSFLEKENILGEDFVVEVNSPGIDRLLKESKDFQRVKGRKILLWLKKPFLEKSFWEGRVVEAGGEELSLEVKDKKIDIPFSLVKCGRQKIDNR